ncbi:MAG: hypothetical protein ACJA2W_004035, partial [Planctomycetota bacterium]
MGFGVTRVSTSRSRDLRLTRNLPPVGMADNALLQISNMTRVRALRST